MAYIRMFLFSSATLMIALSFNYILILVFECVQVDTINKIIWLICAYAGAIGIGLSMYDIHLNKVNEKNYKNKK